MGFDWRPVLLTLLDFLIGWFLGPRFMGTVWGPRFSYLVLPVIPIAAIIWHIVAIVRAKNRTSAVIFAAVNMALMIYVAMMASLSFGD